MPPSSRYSNIPISNPCSKTRCRNGGICQAVKKDGSKSSLPSLTSMDRSKSILIHEFKGKQKYHAKCICPKQYAGLLCEKTNLCLDKCLNGGTCEWSKENIVSCNCKPGFEGEGCEAIKSNNAHNSKNKNLSGDDISDDTDSVNRGITTILGVVICIVIILVIAIGLVLKFRTQRLGHAFRHRRMAESLLTGQTSASRDVPIGEFPNQMFLEDEPDDIEEERKIRSIVKSNKGRFRLRSQQSYSASSSSANFVNPVYQNVYGDGDDNRNINIRGESEIINESETPSRHQNEDNENSFLLIPSTSSYDENGEEETCDTVPNKTKTNRRHNFGNQIYESKHLPMDSVSFESADLLTEKHRGDIKL